MTVITFEITYLLAAVSVLLCLFIAFRFGRYVEAGNHKSVCNLPGPVTTIVACEQLGRKARLMELDPHYCDVIIARWEKLTGQKAVKLNQ